MKQVAFACYLPYTDLLFGFFTEDGGDMFCVTSIHIQRTTRRRVSCLFITFAVGTSDPVFRASCTCSYIIKTLNRLFKATSSSNMGARLVKCMKHKG
jgi:hypothetical protein